MLDTICNLQSKWYFTFVTTAPTKSRREEYSETTRQALLTAARDLFTAEGYQQTGIEAIANAARVTRGAFYHHFEDKKALFEALVIALQSEAVGTVSARARLKTDAWERVREGIDAFLEVCCFFFWGVVLRMSTGACETASQRRSALAGPVVNNPLWVIQILGNNFPF
jgi:AcrR family transcriptional regulator